MKISTPGSVTANGITLLTQSIKYTLPRDTIYTPQFLLWSYRRFIRLRPLVSRRGMVRDTYVRYVSNKYRYEPVGVRRGLILGRRRGDDYDLPVRTYNSLQFILQGVSGDYKDEDVQLARNILKNILTIEYEKLDGKGSGGNLVDYNIEFRHLTGGCAGKRSLVKDKAVESFDELLTYLNETLKTNL